MVMEKLSHKPMQIQTKRVFTIHQHIEYICLYLPSKPGSPCITLIVKLDLLTIHLTIYLTIEVCLRPHCPVLDRPNNSSLCPVLVEV